VAEIALIEQSQAILTTTLIFPCQVVAEFTRHKEVKQA